MFLHEQVIQFVETDELRYANLISEAFELREDRPALFLQKICIWILRKLGCYYIKETVSVSRHILDARTFMERLYKQKGEIFKLLNREPTMVLIGARDYHELMSGPEFTQVFAFSAEYMKDRRIMGLTVKVIPWMRGILVMPE